MRSTAFLISLGSLVATTFAQTRDTSATLSSSIIRCQISTTDCAHATSTPAHNSSTSSSLMSHTNTTSLPFNLSTTMTTVSTSSSATIDYMNTTIMAPLTSISVPTSILIAAGTPTIPDPVSTVTSYQIVGPSGTSAGGPSATPSLGRASSGNTVSMWGIAVAILGISGLMLA